MSCVRKEKTLSKMFPGFWLSSFLCLNQKVITYCHGKHTWFPNYRDLIMESTHEVLTTLFKTWNWWRVGFCFLGGRHTLLLRQRRQHLTDVVMASRHLSHWDSVTFHGDIFGDIESLTCETHVHMLLFKVSQFEFTHSIDNFQWPVDQTAEAAVWWEWQIIWLQ